MPAPVAGPSGKGKLFGLPIWAWAVAIVGGALVGFVLLRKQAPAAESNEDGSSSDGSPAQSGEPVVVGPDLQALGLKPPHSGVSDDGGGGGGGGGDGGGGDPAAASSSSSLSYALSPAVKASLFGAAPTTYANIPAGVFGAPAPAPATAPSAPAPRFIPS